MVRVSRTIEPGLEWRHCPTCDADRLMDHPPCSEHADCPERICFECGTAIVTGWLPVDAPGPDADGITTAA